MKKQSLQRAIVNRNDFIEHQLDRLLRIRAPSKEMVAKKVKKILENIYDEGARRR